MSELWKAESYDELQDEHDQMKAEFDRLLHWAEETRAICNDCSRALVTESMHHENALKRRLLDIASRLNTPTPRTTERLVGCATPAGLRSSVCSVGGAHEDSASSLGASPRPLLPEGGEGVRPVCLSPHHQMSRPRGDALG